MDKEYWRQKKAEQRAKAKGTVTEITESETGVTGGVGMSKWDEERFPNRKAWEIAVMRVERARRYAAKFPSHVMPGEERFQTLEWQYENEGLKQA